MKIMTRDELAKILHDNLTSQREVECYGSLYGKTYGRYEAIGIEGYVNFEALADAVIRELQNHREQKEVAKPGIQYGTDTIQ